MENANILDSLLDEISEIEQAKTDAKMMIASKIEEAIQIKGWKHKDLLNAVGKDSPSVITKWLSGLHNFTIDTLVELEYALEICLLNLDKKKEESINKINFNVSHTGPMGYSHIGSYEKKQNNSIGIDITIAKYGALIKDSEYAK